jgi:hypothetical protein
VFEYISKLLFKCKIQKITMSDRDCGNYEDNLKHDTSPREGIFQYKIGSEFYDTTVRGTQDLIGCLKEQLHNIKDNDGSKCNIIRHKNYLIMIDDCPKGLNPNQLSKNDFVNEYLTHINKTTKKQGSIGQFNFGELSTIENFSKITFIISMNEVSFWIQPHQIKHLDADFISREKDIKLIKKLNKKYNLGIEYQDESFKTSIGTIKIFDLKDVYLNDKDLDKIIIKSLSRIDKKVTKYYNNEEIENLKFVSES